MISAGRVRLGEGAGGRTHGVRGACTAAQGREADDLEQVEAGEPQGAGQGELAGGDPMKTIISAAVAAPRRRTVDRSGRSLFQGQPRRRQHDPQRGLDQPREPLWRQLDARRGRGHRAHQHVRRQHGARLWWRHRAHQHLRRQHLRQSRRGRVPHVSFRRDRLPPAGLSRVSDLSGLSPAGRGAVLLVRLLRLRSGRRCRRRHGGRRGRGFRQHGSSDVERVRGRRCHRQREHGGRHECGV